GVHGKTQTYKSVELEASDLSYSTQFPFTFSAKTPGDGTVKVDGKAGPIDATDSSLTPLNAKLDVSHLDLASTGFVDPSTGVGGMVDFNGALMSDGHQMTSKGDVHIGHALAHLTGAYDTAGAATALQMKLAGSGMPVADLEGVLPAAGVNLPSGASLKSGSMDINLAISGPIDKLVIVGPVNLSNGDLAGF